MTSTPAISQTPTPVESAPSAAASGPNQDFASALSGANAKPAAKSPHAKAKTAAPAGVPLPIGGIVSPPPPVIPVADLTPPASGKAAPAAALAAAMLQHAEAAPGAAVAAPPKSAPAVMEPAPTLDAGGSAPGADAKPAATFDSAAPVAIVPAVTIPVDAAPAPRAAVADAAPLKVILARIAAVKSPSSDSQPAADAEDAATAAAPLAAPAAPVVAATDLGITGSAADAARAAAAVVAGSAPAAVAPDAAPDAGTSAADTGLGQTAATLAASQDAAAATLTAAAVKAAAAAVTATVISSATAQDKHGHPGDASPAAGASSGLADPTQVGMNSSTPPDASPAATMNVSPHVEAPEFGQGVAERVSWMLDNNVSSAKLQVNPPQLGPIEVRIALQGGHAQVWLTSHSAVTRDALESSSPKLREALGAQGFGQVSVDISQRSFQDRPSQSQPYEWTPSANRSSTAIAPAAAASPRASSGMLDAYA